MNAVNVRAHNPLSSRLSCVKAEAAVLDSPSPKSLRVSADVKQQLTKKRVTFSSIHVTEFPCCVCTTSLSDSDFYVIPAFTNLGVGWAFKLTDFIKVDIIIIIIEGGYT